jgi:hypothetical protein
MPKLEDTLADIIARQNRIEKRVNNGANRDAGGGYWMAIPPYDALSPYAVSATIGMITVPRDLTLRKLVIGCLIATTVNSSNYWTITANSLITAPICSISMQTGMTAGVWKLLTTTTFAPTTCVAATDILIYLAATKTGAPGALSVANAALFFT